MFQDSDSSVSDDTGLGSEVNGFGRFSFGLQRLFALHVVMLFKSRPLYFLGQLWPSGSCRV